MGTRADFYVGRGKDAEWLGSIAWSGHPGNIDEQILKAKTEERFRDRVDTFLKSREDATFPSDGWPWPWDDSNTTDYSYAFDGQVWITCFGYGWRTVDDEFAFNETYAEWERAFYDEEWEDEPLSEPEPPWKLEDGEKVEFPDMSDRKKVTMGKRSGLIVISGK